MSGVIMADGINADARAILGQFGKRMPVQCYVNGFAAWTPQEESWFASKIRTSVMSGQPEAARFAREIDVENGAATPDDVLPFLSVRGAGHRDGQVYCSAANVGAVVAALEGQVMVVPRWRIAWWWGRPGEPSPVEVAAEVKRLNNVDIPLDRIWACQYASHPKWDLSIVYGLEDWSR